MRKYRVLQQITPKNYEVEICIPGRWRNNIIHAKRLKKYFTESRSKNMNIINKEFKVELTGTLSYQ